MAIISRKEAAEILGIRHDATQKEVKAAYRKLAIRWHPDKNAGNDEATAEFQSINNAYEYMCAEHGIICSFYAHEDLMYAAEEGDIDEIRALLDADCDITICDRWGFTALHKAAQRGHGAIVVALLNHAQGPELLKRTIKLGGSTALHLAVEKGPSRLFVIEEILKCCSSPEFLNIQDRNTGRTAFQVAVGRLESAKKYGSDDVEQEQRVVDLLRRYGAE